LSVYQGDFLSLGCVPLTLSHKNNLWIKSQKGPSVLHWPFDWVVHLTRKIIHWAKKSATQSKEICNGVSMQRAPSQNLVPAQPKG
jgi:hypothetical protein